MIYRQKKEKSSIKVKKKYKLYGDIPKRNFKYREMTIENITCISVIARKYGTTVAQLVKWNNIKDPDLIYPGQTLRVK